MGAGLPRGETRCAGRAPSVSGHRASFRWAGWSAGTRRPPGSSGAGRSVPVGGMGWLAGGAGRPFEQVQEDSPAPAAGSQVRPRRRYPRAGPRRRRGGRAGRRAAPWLHARRSSAVEGEEDVGAAAQGGGHALHALRAEGGAGGQPPLAQDEPVEDALGRRPPTAARDRAAPCRARAWGRAAPGSGASVRGSMARPASQRTRAPADLGDDHHAGEALHAPLHEQPALADLSGCEAGGRERRAQPAPRRVAEAEVPRPSRGRCPVRRGTPSPRDCDGAAPRSTAPPPSRWRGRAAEPPSGHGPVERLRTQRGEPERSWAERRRAAGSPPAGSRPRRAG